MEIPSSPGAPQRLRGGQFCVWLASQKQPINFAFMARIQGRLENDRLRSALEKLRQKYPALSQVVARQAGELVLMPAPDLEIPVRILERTYPTAWMEETTRELARDFDMAANLPLRLVWMQGEKIAEIIFICPHARTDGISVANLVRDFCSFLNDPGIVVEPVWPNPLLSELIPDFPGRRRVSWLANRKADLMATFQKFWPPSGIPPAGGGESSQFELLAWELTPQQTSALVAHSRAQGASVHAALCVAFLRAFGEVRGNGWKRKIQSPVSLRDRLRAPVGDAFGLYVNLVEFKVDCAPSRNFWVVARQVKQAFTERSQDGVIFRPLQEANIIMDRLGDRLPPEMVAQSFLNVTYDLSITNLGRLDLQAGEGPLHLAALYGPALGGNPEDIVLGVLTLAGQMSFTLTFTHRKLDRTQAEEIKDRAMSWLARATDWPPG